MFHYENSYMIPNARVRGLVCKTNLPSNTAFRGFGGPQGMFCGENMIRHIAEYLNKDFVEVARRNLYKEGDFTHYHQQLEHCTLPRCWDECIESSQFHQRRRDIEIFNRSVKISAINPTRFYLCACGVAGTTAGRSAG